jgi:alpha-L-fucosidase
MNWKATEFYFFIHFGPNTFTNKEWGEERRSGCLCTYGANCGQWARMPKQLVKDITAKHHDDFAFGPASSARTRCGKAIGKMAREMW